MGRATGWTRAAFEEQGFEGWVKFEDLRAGLRSIPTAAGGVYVVLRVSKGRPEFLQQSPAGIWRGDPTEEVPALEGRWIDDCELLYIGKANHGQLRNRLRAFESFGRGGKGRHYGGRYIWQLPDAWNALVAWRILDLSLIPRDIEKEMIADFAQAYGRRPFANISA